MDNKRFSLQSELEAIVPNVYYQPPETIKMVYPCIVYKWSQSLNIHADDKSYLHLKAYEVIIMDRNPDSELPDKLVENFKYVRFNTTYPAEGLHHFVYTLYY